MSYVDIDRTRLLPDRRLLYVPVLSGEALGSERLVRRPWVSGTARFVSIWGEQPGLNRGSGALPLRIVTAGRRFPYRRRSWPEMLPGVRDNERISAGNTVCVYQFHVARPTGPCLNLLADAETAMMVKRGEEYCGITIPRHM